MKIFPNGDWLLYQQLCKAIPANWHLLDNNNEARNQLYYALSGVKKKSQCAYNMLINNGELVRRYYNRLKESSNLNIDYDSYVKAFSQIYNNTKIVKLREFQYRLLLSKIVTNTDLYKWGMKDDNSCNFCKEVPETFEHILWCCPYSKRLWNWYNEICMLEDLNTIDYAEMVIGTKFPKSHAILQEILLLIKQFLYRKRCENIKPNLTVLLKEITQFKDTEMYVARRNSTLPKVLKKWSPIIDYIM